MNLIRGLRLGFRVYGFRAEDLGVRGLQFPDCAQVAIRTTAAAKSICLPDYSWTRRGRELGLASSIQAFGGLGFMGLGVLRL